jgi:hypothetical protein
VRAENYLGTSNQKIVRPQLGLDTQCYSYLIDGISGVSRPTGSLGAQRIALLRLYIYLPGTLWITKTVAEECARIRNTTRAQLHQSFSQTLFGELPLRNPAAIRGRELELAPFHKGANDCRILGEAEDVGHTVLLTFDTKFIRDLASRTTIRLFQPESYWVSLAIPSGVEPDKLPVAENPLAHQAWWRW